MQRSSRRSRREKREKQDKAIKCETEEETTDEEWNGPYRLWAEQREDTQEEEDAEWEDATSTEANLGPPTEVYSYEITLGRLEPLINGGNPYEGR